MNSFSPLFNSWGLGGGASTYIIRFPAPPTSSTSPKTSTGDMRHQFSDKTPILNN
uniref:Uncharacterized protein n=1 Tax=Anguilla anguilla TaxID=7936 RepID=A0A0E9SZ37_ANGAN